MERGTFSYHQKYNLIHTPTMVHGEWGEWNSPLGFRSSKMILFMLVTITSFNPPSWIPCLGFHYFIKNSRNNGN